MKKYLFKDLKLDDYEIREEQLIWWSRPRILLRNKKNNHTYILKSYSKTARELWVEQFASNLWKKIDWLTTVQEVTPKSLSPDIVKELEKQIKEKVELKNIAILIRHAFPSWYETKYGYQILWLKPREITCIDLVYTKIVNRYEWYWRDEKILQCYIDMIVFDALIWNMDRHLENWWVHEFKQLLLEKKNIKDTIQFTTLFDHWSAGLFELDDEKVNYFLDNLDKFEKDYIMKAWYSLIKNLPEWEIKENIFSILKNLYSDKKWRKFIKLSIRKITKLKFIDVAETIFKMPDDNRFDYSRERKELLFISIMLRKKQLEKIIS